MTADPIRVVVADDHDLFRDGLVELLGTVDGLTVVGAAAHGAAAVRTVSELKPDVLVLDAEMPGQGVTDTMTQVAAASPSTRIVILTMHDAPELVGRLMGLGAAGYLVKGASRLDLASAIAAAARNDGTVTVAVPSATFRRLSPARDATGLSLREQAVLALVAQGHSNHRVGTLLGITEATVKRHLTNIYAKLGVLSRVAAVRRAEELGLVPVRSGA